MVEQASQKEFWSGKVGTEWATHADRIDIMLRPMTEVALKLAAFRFGEHVLDIGCGAGATSVEIARAVRPGGSVLGVDLSPQLIEVAQERAAAESLAAEFIEADAGAAKFDRAFDAAFSRFGVMFFDDPAAAFAHLRSSMRDGGRMVFVCWRSLPENTWATQPIDAVKPLLNAPLPPFDPNAPGPFSLSEANKIERVLGDARWRGVEITPWDGAIAVGGGGSVEDSADFLLRIGPCARALADGALDAALARRRLIEALAPLHTDRGVELTAACWIVKATA